MTKWFDITDIADVAIIAMFVYAGLIWFKRTKAFLVAVGIVILGAIFALARYLNLFLTAAMLQGFFAVLLIAIIVIFQEDLRHFFERVALWGIGRRQFFKPGEIIESLVRTTGDLARARVGALIVIAGQMPLDRHIEGGTPLDGKPSEALLKSIFDRSSPGHDGAVIIENNRVARFATYLPLSKDLQKISGFGTRHAAALGLSERCDALCIVVSEERGTISIAKDGTLRAIKDPVELPKMINSYLAEKFPPKQKRRFSNLVRRNLAEKIIAIALSLGLWVIFAYNSENIQRDYQVPVEYTNFPKGLAIERVWPKELTVTLSGDARAFNIFDPENIKITVDASGAREGRQRIPIDNSHVSKIPHNLKLDGIRPEEIDLTLKGEAGAKTK